MGVGVLWENFASGRSLGYLASWGSGGGKGGSRNLRESVAAPYPRQVGEES